MVVSFNGGGNQRPTGGHIYVDVLSTLSGCYVVICLLPVIPYYVLYDILVYKISNEYIRIVSSQVPQVITILATFLLCGFLYICNVFIVITSRRVRTYQRGNQNPYIEEEQTTQWSKAKVQKDKQRSKTYI